MLKLLILFIFVGCSGYRYAQPENPLSQYGISSISVPMFYNYSNFSDVQSDFTREIYHVLSGLSGLKIKSGYHPESDAVLIGILKSPEKISESVRSTNLRLAQSRAENVIGSKRDNFYIPGSSDVQLFLHLIIIKKPTEEEIVLLKSGIGNKLKNYSKIIFNDTIPLKNQFTREILDNEGVQVVGTQNAGVQRKSLKNLAEQAATSFRELILYAF